jgi:hypothetical protein
MKIRAHLQGKTSTDHEASASEVTLALRDEVRREHRAEDLRRLVDREMRYLDAMAMLKYEWLVLDVRLQPILAREAKSGFLSPQVTRQLDKMRIIAVAIGRLEIGATIVRDRGR